MNTSRGPCQEDMDTVARLHGSLKFHGNIGDELPEQLMIAKHLRPDDCVLEFGGSCGRASCIINSLLDDPTKHVVIEPSITELPSLTHNRDVNGLQFSIEPSAVSPVPLYSVHWKTFIHPVRGSTLVNTITWDDLQSKYPYTFTTLIADCEGHLPHILKSFPHILDTIQCVMIEHDFMCPDDLEYFTQTMHQHAFECVDTYRKDDPLGPGMAWSDGLPDDPIFVSVWKRKNVA